MNQENISQNQNNQTFKLNDKEYKLNDLDEKQKYWLVQINQCRQNVSKLQMEIDQAKVAADGFSKMLASSLESNEKK